MLKDHLASQQTLTMTCSRILQDFTGRKWIETGQYTFRYIPETFEQRVRDLLKWSYIVYVMGNAGL